MAAAEATPPAAAPEALLAIEALRVDYGPIAAVCGKVVVLVQGRKVAEGSAAEIQRHPVVIEAYLGSAA